MVGENISGKICFIFYLKSVLGNANMIFLNDCIPLSVECLKNMHRKFNCYILQNVEFSKYNWVREPFNMMKWHPMEMLIVFRNLANCSSKGLALENKFGQLSLSRFWTVLLNIYILTRGKHLSPSQCCFVSELVYNTNGLVARLQYQVSVL